MGEGGKVKPRKRKPVKDKVLQWFTKLCSEALKFKTRKRKEGNTQTTFKLVLSNKTNQTIMWGHKETCPTLNSKKDLSCRNLNQ